SNPDIRDKHKTRRFSKRSPTRSAKAPRSAVFSIVAAPHGLLAKIPHSRRWRVTRVGPHLPWPPPSNSAKFNSRWLIRNSLHDGILLCKKRRTHNKGSIRSQP